MFDHYEVVLEANGWPDGSVWLKRLP